MYLKNLVVADENGGTVCRDQNRLKLWDFVSKLITYVEFRERQGNFICSRVTTIIYFDGKLCAKKAVSWRIRA